MAILGGSCRRLNALCTKDILFVVHPSYLQYLLFIIHVFQRNVCRHRRRCSSLRRRTRLESNCQHAHYSAQRDHVAGRDLVERVASALGVKILEDWYKISFSSVEKSEYGKELLALTKPSTPQNEVAHRNRFFQFVMDCYPEHNWEPWKFDGGKVSKEWLLRDAKNPVRYFEYLREKLGLSTMEELYDLKTTTLRLAGASNLVELYNWSPSQLVMGLYPDHPWELSKFKQVPRDYWSSLENQRAFVENLCKKLGYTTFNDYYQLDKKHFKANGGSGLLSLYSGSIYNMISKLFPEHSWQPWKFRVTTHRWWWSVENQRMFFEALRKELAIADLDGMYNLTSTEILRFGGAGLLKFYNGSIVKAITTVYPEHRWMLWMFTQTRNQFWEDAQATIRKQFFEHIRQQKRFKTLESFYQLTPKDVLHYGGNKLLKESEGSVAALVMAAYPDHDWEPWRFVTPLPGWWDDCANQRRFLEKHVFRTLGYRSLNDCYNLTPEQLLELGGMILWNKYGKSIGKMMEAIFPHHEWLPWRFVSRPKHWFLDVEMRRRFLDHMCCVLGVSSHQELLTFPPEVFARHGGEGVLKPGGGEYYLDVDQMPRDVGPQFVLAQHIKHLLKTRGKLAVVQLKALGRLDKAER